MNWQVNLGAYVKKEVSIEVNNPENAGQITIKNHMLGSRNTEHDISARSTL